MSKKNIKSDLEKFKKTNYRVDLIPDTRDGGFVSVIPDLPGCISQGETEKEALKMISEAKALWIEEELERGRSIPLPREKYSGKFNVRVPKTLHERLVLEAEREGVSLNTEVLAILERSFAKI
ncbi:type II toxin-antitoxin system HicB family antitoxin [bacterium]|nr:type II toxin-antitoxin system HicB family antitoxin [bacterium]